MNTQQNVSTEVFSFTPKTFQEAQEYAKMFANSGLCPEAYRGRPNDILIIWEIGSEMGLTKTQSLRTFGCINGMPFAYGDGLLALVKTHKKYKDMEEWFEGSLEEGTLTAYCTMIRQDNTPVTRSFSIEDAKRAGLWESKGTWIKYKKRMLQHRARGLAARDAFPDALYGIKSEDEVREIVESTVVVEVPTPKSKGMAGLEEVLEINKPEIVDAEIIEGSTENSKISELKNLIERMKVKSTSVSAALTKFGVKEIDELSVEQIDKWINHLKLKESKNAV